MSRLSQFIRSFRSSHGSAWHHGTWPLQRHGFPVAVCWSAKSGCTTVLKWFLAQNGLLDEALAHSSWVHNYRRDKLFRQKDYFQQCDRLMKVASGKTTVIKVIRDPATRAVSSFLHFLRWGEDVASWPGASRFGQWKKAVGLARQPGITFRQFLMCIAAQQRRYGPLDVHFRQQYDAKQDPRVDSFIRLEDLTAGLREIEDQHGLPHVDMRQLSRSFHHNAPSADHDWPEQAAAFVADHQTLQDLGAPPAEIFLDPETLMLIQRAYRADYEAYRHFYDAPAATVPPAARWLVSQHTSPGYLLRKAA